MGQNTSCCVRIGVVAVAPDIFWDRVRIALRHKLPDCAPSDDMAVLNWVCVTKAVALKADAFAMGLLETADAVGELDTDTADLVEKSGDLANGNSVVWSEFASAKDLVASAAAAARAAGCCRVFGACGFAVKVSVWWSCSADAI